MPPGHINAVFITDAHALKVDTVEVAIRTANAQGGFLFWNHPYWHRQSPDGIARLNPLQERLIAARLLLWVCWRMWKELREQAVADEVAAGAAMDDDPTTEPMVKPAKSFRAAFTQILIADISMSLDNVLAVAGAAREHPGILVFGLLMSIALMGVAASWIARLLHRYRWIGYVGLVIVLYVALHMMWQGHQQVVDDLGYAPQYNAVMPEFLDIKPKAPIAP